MKPLWFKEGLPLTEKLLESTATSKFPSHKIGISRLKERFTNNKIKTRTSNIGKMKL